MHVYNCGPGGVIVCIYILPVQFFFVTVTAQSKNVAYLHVIHIMQFDSPVKWKISPRRPPTSERVMTTDELGNNFTTGYT